MGRRNAQDQLCPPNARHLTPYTDDVWDDPLETRNIVLEVRDSRKDAADVTVPSLNGIQLTLPGNLLMPHPREWEWVGCHKIMEHRRRYRLLALERLCWRLRAGSLVELGIP